MINYLEQKYVNLISYKLKRFKKTGINYNFRCPYCGDSKKSESKARGWIFYSKDHSTTKYHCHNCGKDTKFEYFLKDQDYNLYTEYLKDKMLDGTSSNTIPSLQKKDIAPVVQVTKQINLKSINELKEDHPARIYVSSRAIPTSRFNDLYYTTKFKTWVNTLIPNKFEYTNKDEPRLIIPLLNEEGKMFGFQGRSFKPNDPLKYITILLDDKMPKIYGLHNLNKSKTVYAFEGPIDSMFIQNSVASAGGKIETNLKKAGIESAVVIYDNEPRSVYTVKKMLNSIEAGYPICIWPDNIKESDVNNMVLHKINVQQIINDNIYNGLAARLKLIEWKKVDLYTRRNQN